MTSQILQSPPICDGSMIEEELIVLYQRRSVVENLIQCLEEYGRCHAGQIAIKGIRGANIDEWKGLLAS